MVDYFGSHLLSKAICFDIRSTNLVQLSNRSPYFYQFRCHHPLITQLSPTLKFPILEWFCCQYTLINYRVSGPKTYCSLLDIIVFWCYKDGLKKVKDWYVAPKGQNLSLICQVETFITSSGNSVNNAPKITASFAWSLHQHTVCHFNENYETVLLWLG